MCVCWPPSSPDGSYTEEQNSETHVKANINPTSTTPDIDDEFDEDVLPTIGTCKALYPFEGSCRTKYILYLSAAADKSLVLKKRSFKLVDLDVERTEREEQRRVFLWKCVEDERELK